MTTRSQDAAADVAALLRARNPLVWITTREEARVERYLFGACAAAKTELRTWDVAQGARAFGDKEIRSGNWRDTRDPGGMLDAIRASTDDGTAKERIAWVMRDLPPWLSGPAGVTTCRQLRNLAKLLPRVDVERQQTIIVLSPEGKVPPELSNHATVIDWPLPDREEIAQLLADSIKNLSPEMGEKVEEDLATNGRRDAAIDAAVGLAGEEAASCFARSLVQFRKIEPLAVAKEKKRVIARDGLLEWVDPVPGGLDAVGGLDELKAWLIQRKLAYSAQARAYGLRPPKGVLLVGIPGCGKSLSAIAVPTAWGVPLLRIDLGALKSKFVGESETNLRKALAVIGAIGRCVVWLDELEKALAGATQGAADGGVSSDALGTLLTWMQERTGDAFVIATSNDIRALPPELLRKGRFDEIFFVDLPNGSERREIFKATMRANGRPDVELDWAELEAATREFTGSEIASLIPEAMFAAFADGARELTTQDILDAKRRLVPLSQTMGEKIAGLRKFVDEGRARPATTPELVREFSEGRKLDI